MKRIFKRSWRSTTFQRRNQRPAHVGLRRRGNACPDRRRDGPRPEFSQKRKRSSGFDTGSRPSFKKGKSYPTSLIQLAGSELVALDSALNLTPFCGALAGLLADPGIIKAGVAIRDDIRALQKLHEFLHPAGLPTSPRWRSSAASRRRASARWRPSSWACRISKAAQCSNWAKKVPSTPQPDPLCRRHRCVDRPGNLFTYDAQSGAEIGERNPSEEGHPSPLPRPPLPRKTFARYRIPVHGFPSW